MEDKSMPYFMTNKDWYYYDEDDEIYKLTKQAPKEAKESYTAYYKEIDDFD